MRYTIAAPADSTLATAASCSASSRSSGPGTIDRQVGLQQEVVDGLGQHLVHRLDDVVGRVAGQQGADRRGDRAAAHHAQRVRLGQAGRPPVAGCSRIAQRGRRQIIARDAAVASTPAPGGRSASTSSSSRRSSGAAVENSESDSAA